MVVVDSDVIILMLRGDKEVSELFKKAVVGYDGNVFVTPVQMAEIIAGMLPREKTKMEEFFEAIGFFSIGEGAGRLAGEFMNKYGKSHNVTMADVLIAAVTRLNGCLLWTRNRKHYPMFRPAGFYQE